jgi:hypothetical protein
MTYSLGTLPDDPTQERILLEVIENPHNPFGQVMFCLDVATVTTGTEMACEGNPWQLRYCSPEHLNLPGEWPRITCRGLTWDQRRALLGPTLAGLFSYERGIEARRAANREWMQKHRAATRTARSPQPCSHCGATFTPKRSTAQFCSTACRVAAHRARSAESADC